jgi:hypothetical protein
MLQGCDRERASAKHRIREREEKRTKEIEEINVQKKDFLLIKFFWET